MTRCATIQSRSENPAGTGLQGFWHPVSERPKRADGGCSWSCRPMRDVMLAWKRLLERVWGEKGYDDA